MASARGGTKAGVLAAAILAASCVDSTPPTQVVLPSPSPEPAAGCGAPPGTFNENCSRDSATFYDDVDRAIDALIAERPELFDTSRARGCGRCFLVVDPDTFTAELVSRLEAGGLCAFYDGEELGVKAGNDFNDQFDVLTFELYLRRENGSYRSTCRPAWF